MLVAGAAGRNRLLERQSPGTERAVSTPALTTMAPRGESALAVRAVVRVVLVVIAAAVALYLVYRVRTPLAWLFLAGFVALAASTPVATLSRRMRRGFAITIVYLSILLVPAGMLALFVPPIVEQANGLAQNAPRYADDIARSVNKNRTLRELDEKFDLTRKLQQQAAELPGKLGNVANVLADIGSGIVSSVFAGVTILTLSLFMIGGGPRWRQALIRRQPPDRAEALDRLFTRVSGAVGGYVRGALLQALIAGVTSWIVLLVLGVPYAAPLGVVIFIFDLIPLVGATVGAVLVGIVTLFHSFPTATIVWVVWSIVYQQVENNLIQPRIQSRAVQVEPFVIIVSVLFGATLFGVFGALLAVPVAASIQVALVEYLRFRRAGRATAEVTPAPSIAEGSDAPGGS